MRSKGHTLILTNVHEHEILKINDNCRKLYYANRKLVVNLVPYGFIPLFMYHNYKIIPLF